MKVVDFFPPQCSFRVMLPCLIFIHTKSPLSPSYTDCLWLFVEKLKTWCCCKNLHSHSSRQRLYALDAASHSPFLFLVIFPHNHRFSPYWVPEFGMTFCLVLKAESHPTIYWKLIFSNISISAWNQFTNGSCLKTYCVLFVFCSKTPLQGSWHCQIKLVLLLAFF